MIPLSDVKIVLLNNIEISIGYINRIANNHCLRFKSQEETKQWVRILELATQQDIRKVVKSVPARSLQLLAGSVKDLKNMASSGSVSEEEEEMEWKRSYLPVYWDEEQLKAESFGCFSPHLQLDEYYGNSGVDGVKQGWRVLGGTLEDIILWCLITCNRPASGKQRTKSWRTF